MSNQSDKEEQDENWMWQICERHGIRPNDVQIEDFLCKVARKVECMTDFAARKAAFEECFRVRL